MTDPGRERQRRWRLVLGSDPRAETPPLESGFPGLELDQNDRDIDAVLQALYDSNRSAGLGSSCPKVVRWLGDIRRFFPTSVVRLMQRDALERLKLREMLLQPETLEALEADVHLAATLLSLKSVIPEKTKETARQVVRKVTEEVLRKLRGPLTAAVRGSLRQTARTMRPRQNEIDWDRTIRRNLKHYIPERKAVIPEQLVGNGRQRSALQDVILCVDQSGSMAASVVYAGIFASVLASLPAVSTRMVAFDTEIVDLTDLLHDPVELLFGVQLGGGTDIHRAVAYCEPFVQRPERTLFVLISDLYEGGDVDGLLRRAARLQASGVAMLCLLALSDDGAPAFNEPLAAELSGMGIPAFACTPDQFPELISIALRRQDVNAWASRNDIPVRGAGQGPHLS